MSKSFYIIILVVFNLVLIKAEDSSKDSLITFVPLPATIDSIFITGETETDFDIIERELTIKVGQIIDSTQLYYDRERIYSLGIFTRVNLSVIRINEKNILRIFIKDSWNIWPIPFAYILDNNWKRFSFGLDLYFHNFRGRNEKFRIKGGAGFDPMIGVQYSIPDLHREKEISLDFNIDYKSVTNRSPRAEMIYGSVFEQKFFGTSVMIGKRYNLFHKFYAYTGFSYIETPFYDSLISIYGDRIDRIGYVGFRYTYDTRDLIQYPSKGISLFVDYQLKGIGNPEADYKIFHFDFRNYESVLFGITSKWRFATRQVFGEKIPFYDYSIIGYGERIRGHYNKKIEGDNLYIGSFELRHSIINNWDISFDLPIVPTELTTYRVEIHAQIFADAGFVEKRNYPVSLRDIDRGFGFGFTFLILPYNIARAELAFNESLKSEIILVLGISF
jgi:outer membrane protein assembly factor BamA